MESEQPESRNNVIAAMTDMHAFGWDALMVSPCYKNHCYWLFNAIYGGISSL